MAILTDPDMMGFVQLTTDEALECEKAFKEHGANGCLEYFKLKRDEWKTIPVNVAVIGISGSGKSTFVNTIRGLRSKDPGAARVGVNETTMRIKSYAHPRNPMLVFWDLPGAGTDAFPKETYLQQIEVDKYDCFVIITSNRFFEIDAWLGEEIRARRKGFYYVRTKIGTDITNDIYENGPDHNAARLIAEIRETTMEKVTAKLQFEAPLFLIDSHHRNKHDFDDLERQIVVDLPKHKSSAMILSLSAFSVSMIKAKVSELRKRAWFMSVVSAGVAAVPLPGLSIAIDLAILLEEAVSYYSQLGLDMESLERRANLLSVDVTPLHQIVQRHFPTELTINLIKSTAVGSIHVVGSAIEEFVRIIPFVGSLIAAPLSLAVTRYTLGCILDKMEAVALEIADFTAQNLTAGEEVAQTSN